nr:helix-turn-helix domain-containing protein [Pantoea stewartii]
MLVTTSNKELHRLTVIQAVTEKRMRRRDAAPQLDLSERQVQRLMNRYRESGAAGLTDARRGKPGTHRIDEALRHRILTLLRENHVGFGPQVCRKKMTKVVWHLNAV